MGFSENVKRNVVPYWRSIMIVAIPVALAPIPIILKTVESRCGYVVLLMALYWMTEALPLAVTSLIPVVLFPLLGVLSTEEVCISYLKETVMMFLGSLIVALAIEHCNLHRRISLRVLMLVGATPRWLMLGFMLNTMFLSMWINNTAATAMMVPIVEAVVEELYKDQGPQTKASLAASIEHGDKDYANGGENQRISTAIRMMEFDHQEKESHTLDKNTIMLEESEKSKESKDIRKCMLLALAYSANLGGTGSVTGTGPNLAFKGIFRSYGPNTTFNFASWMAFNVPGMLICTFLAWIWLQLLFLGFRKEKTDRQAEVKAMIRAKYEELGPMRFHEGATLTLFILLVGLWFFREPQFIPGWTDIFPSKHIDDATAAMFVAVLMFMLPAKLDFWWFRSKDDPRPRKSGPSILTWSYVQERMPWGIVLLLGGGFALADACKKSGLSAWLGQQLVALDVLPPFAIVFVVCIMTATVTEVASNTATANILLPVLAKMSEAIHVNPLYLMVPATVTCSYAFMLPVATPPNALVFVAGNMKSSDMMKAGFIMNLICVVVICVLMEVLGGPIFDAKVYPDWAFDKVAGELLNNGTLAHP